MSLTTTDGVPTPSTTSLSVITSITIPSSTSSSTTTTSSTTSSSSSSSSSSTSSASAAYPTTSQSPSSTTLTPTMMTTLSTASMSTWQSTAVVTSDGHAITSVVTVTSLIPPGSVITPGMNSADSKSKTNIGVIVGGVIGGIGALLLIVLLVWFLLRRQRIKNEFDGNFDPKYITSAADKHGQGHGVGGATLPRMDLADQDMMEDDGMGGRLGAGAGGGGVISPYAYQPPVPVTTPAAGLAGAAVQGHQRNPSYGQPHQFYDNSNPAASLPSAAFSSESRYPATNSTANGPGLGYNVPNAFPYANPIGRGPSPGPSVLSGHGAAASSEHSSAGFSSPYGGIAAAGAAGAGAAYSQYSNEQRSAKEMEAMGMRAPHIMNPDQSAAAGGAYYPVGVHSQTTQAYLQQGPIASSGSQQQQYYNAGGAPQAGVGIIPDTLRPGGPQPHHAHATSTSTTASAPPPVVRSGSAVVVHQDGGRVVMRKGDRVDEEQEALEEIPPTYDSLVQGGQGSSAGERRKQ